VGTPSQSRAARLTAAAGKQASAAVAEALIDHHRVIEKIRTDIPAGELTLQDMERFND
jgi:hypothetical protein